MTKIVTAVALLLALQVTSIAGAEDAAGAVKLEGDIVCAKCTLHTPGLEECQNVLSVKGDGADVHYWLVKNDVSKAYGEVCETVRPVTVTGTVEEKDGKKWIAPTKIENRGDS